MHRRDLADQFDRSIEVDGLLVGRAAMDLARLASLARDKHVKRLAYLGGVESRDALRALLR